MPMTICEHCERTTNTAVIDHDQGGKCLATFNSESKSYEKGCVFDTAHELDQKSANDIINRN